VLFCAEEVNMRCEDCGRTIQNAEMWQLSGDRGAPPAKSMKSLCWTCREAMSPLERPLPLEGAVVEQARAVVRGYESAQ
jgi:hypothetical protein